jgi:hypothetical protein
MVHTEVLQKSQELQMMLSSTNFINTQWLTADSITSVTKGNTEALHYNGHLPLPKKVTLF